MRKGGMRPKWRKLLRQLAYKRKSPGGRPGLWSFTPGSGDFATRGYKWRGPELNTPCKTGQTPSERAKAAQNAAHCARRKPLSTPSWRPLLRRGRRFRKPLRPASWQWCVQPKNARTNSSKCTHDESGARRLGGLNMPKKHPSRSYLAPSREAVKWTLFSQAKCSRRLEPPRDARIA